MLHLLCVLQVENIGARRLHTVLERLVEDISFEAPDKVGAAVSQPLDSVESPAPVVAAEGSAENKTVVATVQEAAAGAGAGQLAQQAFADNLEGHAGLEGYYYEHVVDKQQVREKLQSLLKQDDLSKYIL